MPLDDAHRLIFVHVPKNAGTALVDHLRMRAQGHRTWRSYAAEYPREWAAYTSFAVLRDPLNRFLSNVAYARMERSHWHARRGDARHGTHPDFSTCRRFSTLEIAHILAENPRALRHPGWLPQWSWIADDDGRVQVAHLLRYDHLEDDLRTLGIAATLPRVNVSDRATEEPVTPELEALVRRVYAEDYRLFFPSSDEGPRIVPRPMSPIEAPPRMFDSLEAHLAELCAGAHVAEVGALGATNAELLSLALTSGARSAAKLDPTPLGHPRWAKFEARLEAGGFPRAVNAMSLALDALPTERDHGLFDLVICSGFIFHVPSPFRTLLQLRALTRRYLVLGSMTVPERITNDAGSIDLSGGAAYFGPALHGEACDVLRVHCTGLKIGAKNFEGASPVVGWLDASGTPSEAPWWWFWSVETLTRTAEAAGFRRVATYETWPGRAHTVVLEVAATTP